MWRGSVTSAASSVVASLIGVESWVNPTAGGT
jgi:hypothetical protein